MRNMILVIAFLVPSAASAAEALEIRAGDYSCDGIAQTIREHKAVFVRMGFAGRSFRYPPARCDLGDMYTTVRLRDRDGQMCVLDYACVKDPSSFYNRLWGRF